METMSLYAEYVKERLGETVLEDDYGFISYHIEFGSKVCVINDLYVRPEYRRKGLGTQLGDQALKAARESGCNIILCYIWPSAIGSTEAMMAILGYGFRLKAVEGPRIILTLDLGG